MLKNHVFGVAHQNMGIKSHMKCFRYIYIFLSYWIPGHFWISWPSSRVDFKQSQSHLQNWKHLNEYFLEISGSQQHFGYKPWALKDAKAFGLQKVTGTGRKGEMISKIFNCWLLHPSDIFKVPCIPFGAPRIGLNHHRLKHSATGSVGIFNLWVPE